MNNPPEPPRMSSLDRRIEAARRRGERERAAAHPQPTQGLTSTMSTESCDIAQPRNQAPTLLFDNWSKARSLWAEIASYGIQCSTTKELAPSHARVQAMKEVERMEDCLPADRLRASVSQAMNVLSRAMQEDPDYARGWHDNIAMAFKDSWEQQAAEEGKNISTATRNLVHQQANRAAAHFMHLCFNANTSKHADEVSGTANAWQDTRPVKPNPNPVVGPDSVLTGFEWAPEELAKMQSCHKRGLDRLLYAPKETPADPVHTIIQQEAATGAGFTGELKIYSEAIGKEAQLKKMQEALLAASKPLISQVIVRDFGSGGAPQETAAARLEKAWQEDQQARLSGMAASACLRGAIPAYLTDAQQVSQQAQLTGGDNTLRGIGNASIGGNGAAGAKVRPI